LAPSLEGIAIHVGILPRYTVRVVIAISREAFLAGLLAHIGVVSMALSVSGGVVCRTAQRRKVEFEVRIVILRILNSKTTRVF
jgi:hypothetical protein